MHAEFLEVVAAVGQLFGQRVLVHVGPVLVEQRLRLGDQRIEVQFALLLGLIVGPAGFRQARRAVEHRIGRTHVLGAVRRGNLLRHLADIVALVAIGRERHGDAVLFQVAQPGRQAEDVHLAAGVVDVVFAGDVPAGKGQQAGQRRAVGGAAAVADVQRPSGGRHEFDLHLLQPPSVARRNSRPPQHRLDDGGLGAASSVKLMKPARRLRPLATSDETGSSLSSCCAMSRGFFLSALASCIARLVAKSPCVGSRGRSSWIGVSVAVGATLARACWSRPVSWDLTSWAIDLWLK
jgi:hypothetical protein